MEITWEEINRIAAPGDRLLGDGLYQYDWIKDSSGEYQKVKKPVKFLVFWDCIHCLTDKPNVRENAKYFLKYNGSGVWTKYTIIGGNTC